MGVCVFCCPCCCSTPYLFNVTEQRYAAQCPVLWIEVRLKINGAHVLEVCALWFPVDRTLVQLGILAGSRVDGVYVDNRHLFIEHLHFGLNQLAAAAIQRSTCNKNQVRS